MNLPMKGRRISISAFQKSSYSLSQSIFDQPKIIYMISNLFNIENLQLKESQNSNAFFNLLFLSYFSIIQSFQLIYWIKNLLKLSYHSLNKQLDICTEMPPKSKKKTKVALQRMLLEPVPETPVPQPYFNIPAPQPYVFPLSSTLLEGIKLLQNYFPEDINEKIHRKLTGRRIERMGRYKDTYCMLGKDGNGLLIGDYLMEMRGITAFAYGPNYLILAFQDLRLEVYNMQMKLIKALKNFSPRKITFLKILSVPKNYESIILLSNCGNKVMIHRIQKSLFSTLSCKLSKQIISNLQFPVTQMTEIPAIFKYYLRRDASYKDCSLVCVSAVNAIYIIRINHFKLDMDFFWTVVHTKKVDEISTNSVSWGQANIQAPSRDIKGDKLILTYSFGNKIYFLVFKEVEKYEDNESSIKCEWVESYPFELREKKVAFCQYIKKNEIIIITEDNTILVFHTKTFDIFQKAIRDDQIEMLSEQYSQNLQGRIIQTIAHSSQIKPMRPKIQSEEITQEEAAMLGQEPLVTYADTFLYEYPSNEIFFLSEKQFGVYVYCGWKLIADLLKVEQRYECCMNFLIAMYKKANRFDLELQGSQKKLSQYIQVLAVDFINKKLGKIKDIPQIINNLVQNEEFFKMVIIPIEFLIETEQYDFLFQVVKQKIIYSLAYDQTKECIQTCQTIFFTALTKFIEYGRVKYIPQTQMQQVLDYYINHDQSFLVDTLAIYFDLSRIDRNIVIQCQLQNNLVVSLAHICTQGNQSQFVTPFVKFWGISENYKRHGDFEDASIYAFRALWYVKLCLQRNWVLKEYSFDKYAKMIVILSQHFLTDKILLGLLESRAINCLDTLSFYFTIENSQIVNQMSLKLGKNIQKWIVSRQGNQQLQILVTSIISLVKKAIKDDRVSLQKQTLFLSSIIIYKTVRFSEQKYYQIIIELIRNYNSIKQLKYGLEDKMIEEYEQQFSQYSQSDLTQILASRYINKILTLVYYQCRDYIHSRLYSLYEESRQFNLTDLQAEISFLEGKYSNCIELYVRSKTACKILLFEFLENSFKRLVLERKKEQKNNLAACIKREIKYMVGLNPQKTKNIVQVYIPEIQQELINALGDDQGLQLQYLEGIINDDQKNQMKMKLSQNSILRYVQLMAKYKPDGLIAAFKKNPHFSIEESLKICETYEVYDCMEYLYERMGSIAQSVKIAALRIDQILQKRNNYDDDNFAPYVKVKEILDNAIEVCKKNHSQQIWESLLDSSIQLYQRYQAMGLPEDQIQIFYYINGEIMENLASNCSIEHTITLLKDKYSSLNMGGKMTKAFINILSNLSHSINILYLASDLVENTLQKNLQDDYIQKLKCFHTDNSCQTCHYKITKRQKSIHFRCGHCYHKECVVLQQPMTCLVCLMDRSDQFSYYLNTLNPKFPKIKKINQLFEKFTQQRLEMSQRFKVEQQERIEKRENNEVISSIGEKKKSKLLKFDEIITESEVGNRRVLGDLN